MSEVKEITIDVSKLKFDMDETLNDVIQGVLDTGSIKIQLAKENRAPSFDDLYQWLMVLANHYGILVGRIIRGEFSPTPNQGEEE